MSHTIKPHKVFEIYTDGRRIYTQSILPGTVHFEEFTVKQDGTEYREIDPRRSKLAASIIKGCTNAGIRKEMLFSI